MLILVFIDNRNLHGLLGGVTHAYRVNDYTTVILEANAISPAALQVRQNTPRVPVFTSLGEITGFYPGLSRPPPARPGRCLHLIHSTKDDFEGASQIPYADYRLYKNDVNGTNVPSEVCEINTGISSSYASGGVNPLNCENGFICKITRDKMLQTCPDVSMACPESKIPTMTPCCYDIFNHGGFFQLLIQDDDESKYTLTHDTDTDAFIWSNPSDPQNSTNTFRLYDRNRMQLYANPFTIHEDIFRVDGVGTPVFLRHSFQPEDANHCGVEQIYTERDNNSYSINVAYAGSGDETVEIVQYPYQVGGSEFLLKCVDKLPVVPEEEPKKFCLAKNPIVTTLSMTIKRADDCLETSFVSHPGLQFRVSGGYVMCVIGQKLEILPGDRCPFGDVYFYRSNSSVVIFEENSKRSANVTGWAILYNPGDAPAYHLGLTWDASTHEIGIKKGNYLHTLHIDCPYHEECWVGTSKQMSISFIISDFPNDQDTLGQTSDVLKDFYAPRVDWKLQNHAKIKSKPTPLTLTGDVPAQTIQYADPLLQVDKTRLFGVHESYETFFNGSTHVITGDAGKLGLLFDTPDAYPFLADVFKLCKNDFPLPLDATYWNFTLGKVLVCPPDCGRICYEANLYEESVVIDPKNYMKGCENNLTDIGEIPEKHIEAFGAGVEILASAEIGNVGYPYLNMELLAPDVDGTTGCPQYNLSDPQFPLGLKSKFAAYKNPTVVSDEKNITQQIVTDRGDFSFRFNDEEKFAFLADKYGACLFDIDISIGRNPLRVEIPHPARYAFSTFEAFRTPPLLANKKLKILGKSVIGKQETKHDKLYLDLLFEPQVFSQGDIPVPVRFKQKGSLCQQWNAFFKASNATLDYPRNTYLYDAGAFYWQGCDPVCLHQGCLKKAIVSAECELPTIWW